MRRRLRTRFLIVERFDRYGVRTVGESQEARKSADVAGLVGVTECIPFREVDPFHVFFRSGILRHLTGLPKNSRPTAPMNGQCADAATFETRSRATSRVFSNSKPEIIAE